MFKAIKIAVLLTIIIVKTQAQIDITKNTLISTDVILDVTKQLKKLSTKSKIKQNIWIEINFKRSRISTYELSKILKKYPIGGVFLKNATLKDILKYSESIKRHSKNRVIVGLSFDEKIKINSPEISIDFKDIQYIKSPKILNELGDYLSNFFKSCGVNYIHINNSDFEIPTEFLLSMIDNNIEISNDFIKKTERVFPTTVNLNIIDKISLLKFRNYKSLTRDLNLKIKQHYRQYRKNKTFKQKTDNNCRNTLILKSIILSNPLQFEHNKILEYFSKSRTQLLLDKINNSTISLLVNNRAIPILDLDRKKIALITLKDSLMTFPYYLSKYTVIKKITLRSLPDSNKISSFCKRLDNFNTVIIKLDSDYFTTNTKKIKKINSLIKSISLQANVILSVFGTTEFIDELNFREYISGLTYARDNTSSSQKATAQILFGGLPVSGMIPYETKHFAKNRGEVTTNTIRFEYARPEACGIDQAILDTSISKIANEGILEQAYPGCQILVAKDRKIIYHKQFGHHTYFRSKKVKEDDVYDLASVTKILGSLPALMKLVDEQKIDLDNNLSKYWPDFKNSNKKNLKFREVLAHHAGLSAWIPYWKETVNSDGTFKSKMYSFVESKSHKIPVNHNMYLNGNMKKVFYKQIKESPLSQRKKYKYSGLAFFLYPEIISNITGTEYTKYINTNFYHSLGAYTLTYRPLDKFNIKRIIPTEFDEIFRHTIIRGYVHDESAAMFGGISGNAGLFSTINDVAKIMQMYLQMGRYGGKKYISNSVMNEFTRCQYESDKNRRGLGFDKPLLNNNELSIEETYPAISASRSSFGHSGFTGTFVWADPEYDLIFIFLSNRVYPTRKNRKLYDLNIRPRILQSIYDSFLKE